MPQTNTALNTIDAVVEVSVNGTAWTNISGSTNKVEPPEITADIGSVATLEGQYKIVRAGKFNPAEIKVTIVYSENAATEAFAILYTQANLPGKPIYLRWTPGGSNGEDRFFTADATDQKAVGRISRLQIPGADAETPAPTLLSFTIVATKIGKEHLTVSPSASLSPSASASA
jgi:hypothetical protein